MPSQVAKICYIFNFQVDPTAEEILREFKSIHYHFSDDQRMLSFLILLTPRFYHVWR